MLGEAVAREAPPNPLVLGLPRGGVPVAFEVAAALGCDLDVLLVRKIGVPFQPELAMGAVAEGDVLFINDDLIPHIGVSDESLGAAQNRARGELQSAVDRYREETEAIDPQNRTVVIVDDGLATGSTATAAIEALRQRHPQAVWLAVPVAPPDTSRAMEEVADKVIVLARPEKFGAVGLWYDDFSQTDDDEVRDLVKQSRLR